MSLETVKADLDAMAAMPVTNEAQAQAARYALASTIQDAVDSGSGTVPPHAHTHELNGSDQVLLAQSQVYGLPLALTQKQDKDDNLTALAGLTGATDKVPYFTGLATMALATLTSFGRSLVAAVDAAAAKALLSLTKSDVGLSNVDNTADASKSVLYATSAGSAASATTASTATYATTAGSATPTGHAASHGVAGSDPVTLDKSQVGLGNVDNTADANKSVLYATSAGSATTATSATSATTAGYATTAGSATPTAHASSHGSAGSDPITLAQSQVTNLSTDLGAKVAKVGDSMTGVLSIGLAGDANTFTQAAATGHVMIGTATDITTYGGAKLQVRETGSSSAQWRGRVVAGGANYVFLMGEYNTQAWLGAHNGALSSWADMYLNGGGGNVAVGGNGTVPTNKLEVNGSFKATGSSTLGGTVTMSADFSATAGRLRGTATGANWSGRLVAGGPSYCFLMGQFNDQAWLGAHNDALTAWANLYINPQNGSGTAVYIGNVTGASGQPIMTIDSSTGKATIGFGGTALNKVVVYTPSLTPSSVSGNTTSEQTYTVTGLATGDTIVVNPPSATAGIGLVGFRVSATDTLKLTWANNTSGSLTPPSGTYRILAVRS